MLWPALPVLAALAALIAFLRSEATRPRRKGMIRTTAVAAAISVLGVVLMGIPGAVLYELSAPVVRLLLGADFADLGDGAWPAAIILTLTWPSSLVLAYAAAYGPLRRAPGWVRGVTLVLIPYATAVALSLWAHLA